MNRRRASAPAGPQSTSARLRRGVVPGIDARLRARRRPARRVRSAASPSMFAPVVPPRVASGAAASTGNARSGATGASWWSGCGCHAVCGRPGVPGRVLRVTRSGRYAPRALPYVLTVDGVAVASAVPSPNLRSVVALTDDEAVVDRHPRLDLRRPSGPRVPRLGGRSSSPRPASPASLARPLRRREARVQPRRPRVPADGPRRPRWRSGPTCTTRPDCPTARIRSCCSCTATTRRATGASARATGGRVATRWKPHPELRGLRLRGVATGELRLRRRLGERERGQRARQPTRRHGHAPARRTARGAPRSVAGMVDDGRRAVRGPVRRRRST